MLWVAGCAENPLREERNMKIQNNGFLSIEQLQDQYLSQKKESVQTGDLKGMSFREVLEKQQTQSAGEVKFSKHAVGRLADRNIELTQGQMERLTEGTAKAQQKGIKDSLVIVDDLAFIVNVRSHTVVTAMDQNDTAENIFTNIDGAVII
jgi:flagellar operon protein